MDQPEKPQDSPHPYYEIHVRSQLDSAWGFWFDDLEVTPQENGQTLIAGPVQDQAALLAILTKVFRLNLTLLSVKRIDP